MKVVISLTTIPSRIDSIRPTLDSLLNQRIKPHEIAINLPRYCLKEKCGYDIPSWLWEMEGIEIYRCDKDYGPATKLFPTLNREKDPETRIITVDDDIIYSKEVVELLAANPVKSEYTIIGLMGTFRDSENKTVFIHSESISEDHSVDLLGGYRGVCYRRGLICKSIYDDFYKLCQFAGCLVLDDDGFISRYLKHVGIKQRVISGMPQKKNGELGFLNFEFRSVPKESGLFVDTNDNSFMEKFKAIFDEFYGK